MLDKEAKMSSHRKKLCFILLVVFISFPNISKGTDSNELTVSAPLYTDSAGFVGNIAVKSVFRIICSNKNRMGTGFLHKSGNILTAAHVVSECEPNDVLIILPQGLQINVLKIIKDDDMDIAALIPSKKIIGDSLPITAKTEIPIGSQVSTWGFPAGYTGIYPMLSVGYLSGQDGVKTDSGKIVGRLVVNAAFNSGNSGGPLIDVDSGSVIGIVSSKLAPIPQSIEKSLEALSKVEFGVTWETTAPDGSKGKISQSQLLEKILQYLRSQTQLVVGLAVLPSQLNNFLKNNNLEN
jgi:S1-C subfamily serine protease